ncbi:MAG: hypothetical protein WBP52_03535 [Terriglobales bacterium]|jgi:hypothetical protein
MDSKRLNSVEPIRLKMAAIRELVRRRALSPVEGRALLHSIAEEWLKRHPTSKMQLDEKFNSAGIPTAQEIERSSARSKNRAKLRARKAQAKAKLSSIDADFEDHSGDGPHGGFILALLFVAAVIAILVLR